ncbi:hypothetical protein R3X27_02200 [Tropicimonas sp. TH_r6]|uniref:hypothetical protein n=1 Tax=Tropicimonas sp. TH_r6 TaxID=3082085 RepID=UPI002952C979|nr:hypothetical protein [Tropicimonas sp. TH_r6]MDV7141485.1 hypothetical protein [Tropicimonas sp. TH_r6]
MEILKTSIDWTKAEMLSSAFFVLFGAMFISGSLGFWQLGKTDVARAYVIPALIAGLLLLILGVGLFIQSKERVTGFETAYNSDASAFVASEIERADQGLGQYRIAVFRVMPQIIAVCAMLLLFLEAPVLRASLIVTIAMMSVLLLIDTNASARLEIYQEKLRAVERAG